MNIRTLIEKRKNNIKFPEQVEIREKLINEAIDEFWTQSTWSKLDEMISIFQAQLEWWGKTFRQEFYNTEFENQVKNKGNKFIKWKEGFRSTLKVELKKVQEAERVYQVRGYSPIGTEIQMELMIGKMLHLLWNQFVSPKDPVNPHLFFRLDRERETMEGWLENIIKYLRAVRYLSDSKNLENKEEYSRQDEIYSKFEQYYLY